MDLCKISATLVRLLTTEQISEHDIEDGEVGSEAPCDTAGARRAALPAPVLDHYPISTGNRPRAYSE